jgi:hypothetical protein
MKTQNQGMLQIIDVSTVKDQYLGPELRAQQLKLKYTTQ